MVTDPRYPPALLQKIPKPLLSNGCPDVVILLTAYTRFPTRLADVAKCIAKLKYVYLSRYDIFLEGYSYSPFGLSWKNKVKMIAHPNWKTMILLLQKSICVNTILNYESSDTTTETNSSVQSRLTSLCSIAGYSVMSDFVRRLNTTQLYYLLSQRTPNFLLKSQKFRIIANFRRARP